MEMKNSMLKKKKNESFQKKNQGGKKSNQILSFNLGGVFNIFITLIDYCGGYPRAMGCVK